jgi:hypothetical protein
MRILLKVETPLSTTVNVSNQILMLIYQKLKTNIQVKEEKALQEIKNLKDTFYLIFLTRTLTLRHFKLSKILKSILLKLKTLTLSQKPN